MNLIEYREKGGTLVRDVHAIPLLSLMLSLFRILGFSSHRPLLWVKLVKSLWML